MKKILICLLALSTTMISCQNDTINTNSDSNEINSSEIISNSETDNIVYEDFSFADINEIYLLENETYNIEKMMIYQNSFENLSISYSNDCITYENGIITGNKIGNCTLDIKDIDNKLKQTIDIKVVDYFEYGSYFTSIDVGRLYNKNVVFFGDSITHNWAKYPTGNNDVVNDTDSLGSNYIAMLDKKCDFASVTNAAWSGGTMSTANTSERPNYKSFATAVINNKDAIANSDYIFVWYGTNDYTDQLPIINKSYGEDLATNNEEVSSFVGSAKYAIKKIKEYKSNAQIIFLNLLYRSYPANSNKYSISDYNNAISDLSKTYLCRHIDMYSLFSPFEFSANSKYSKDGLHPNDLGYQVITNYLLNNGEKII